ncbi:MAG: prepilin-type N-terminal cleavage/methylation domain-containing protein [Candidatus Saccharibacteria bacterium]|nr:prepilin-type N-terminal cleavage/methylation domain-containing protein [Candidatus Saccharibacteria bacterium]
MRQRGFTIVEIIIVLVVLGILMTLGGLAWYKTQQAAADNKAKSDIAILTDAIEQYYQRNGEYPFPASSATPCAWASATQTECKNGELARLLVPTYLKELPKDRFNNHYWYVTRRASGSSSAAFGIRVLKTKTTTCKVGKDMVSGWWGNAPSCDF